MGTPFVPAQIKRWWLLLLVLLPTLLLSASVSAQETDEPAPVFEVNPGDPRTNLAPWLEAYEEPGSSMTMEQLLADPDAVAFAPLSAGIPSAGFTPRTTWLRLNLLNNSDKAARWLLVLDKPGISEVEFALTTPEGELLDHVLTGASLPFSTRPIPITDFAFEAPLPGGSQRILYWRLLDTLPRSPGLFLSSAEQLTSRTVTEQLLFGAVYGSLIVMAVYHLLLFATLRERSYLLLVLYTVAVIGTYLVADGHGHQYIWQNNGNVQYIVLPLSVAFSGIFLVLLTAELLDTRTRARRWHGVLLAFGLSMGLTVVAMPF
ncbi:MAG: 7TMR-DISM family protein, partial [Caldilineaceae bacterium]